MNELSSAEKKFISNINNYTMLLGIFIGIVWLCLAIMIFYPITQESLSSRFYFTPIIMTLIALYFTKLRQLLLKFNRVPNLVHNLSKSEKGWTSKSSLYVLRVLGLIVIVFGITLTIVGFYSLIFIKESTFDKLNLIRIIFGSLVYIFLGWLIYKANAILNSLFIHKFNNQTD